MTCGQGGADKACIEHLGWPLPQGSLLPAAQLPLGEEGRPRRSPACLSPGQTSCWQVEWGWVRVWALPVLVSITPGTLRPGERPLRPNTTQGSGAGSSLAFVPVVGGDLGMGGGSASGWSVTSAGPALLWALAPRAEVRTC